MQEAVTESAAEGVGQRSWGWGADAPACHGQGSPLALLQGLAWFLGDVENEMAQFPPWPAPGLLVAVCDRLGCRVQPYLMDGTREQRTRPQSPLLAGVEVASGRGQPGRGLPGAGGHEKQAVVASGAQQGHSSARYPLGRVLDLGRVFEINVSLMKTTLFT